MFAYMKTSYIFVRQNNLKNDYMETKNVTLEQIQEKIGGKIWGKGDLKRLYLDRGYNTKKMSTKTYVEMIENGYVVKCFIECPSQDWNWIKSQQNEVIQSVEREIEEKDEEEETIETTEKIVKNFGVGQNVKHSKFGIGKILFESDTHITVSFNSTSKQFVKEYVTLELVS